MIKIDAGRELWIFPGEARYEAGWSAPVGVPARHDGAGVT